MARAPRVGETTPRTMKASSAARVDPATPAMTRPSSTPRSRSSSTRATPVSPSTASRTGVGRPTIYRRWSSKPALVIAALTQSVGLSPTPDTGALRDDLLAFQRQQLKMMDRPESRRVTAGLVADLVGHPELAESYFGDYIDRARCRCGKPSSAASSAANCAPMPTSPSSTTFCSGRFSCARSCAANRSTPSWPHRLSTSSWLPSAPQEHVGGVGPLPGEVRPGGSEAT